MIGLIVSVGLKPKWEFGMALDFARGKRTCLARLAGAFLIVMLDRSLMAQALGELTGTVTDPARTPVAFALVTATHVETGRALPAATTTDGSYRFSLPSGKPTARTAICAARTALQSLSAD
jgi:hypothetical protein